MSKRELIDTILQYNRSAAPEFLARFAETDLKAYLDRVCQVSPRRISRVLAAATRSESTLLAV